MSQVSGRSVVGFSTPTLWRIWVWGGADEKSGEHLVGGRGWGGGVAGGGGGGCGRGKGELCRGGIGRHRGEGVAAASESGGLE